MRAHLAILAMAIAAPCATTLPQAGDAAAVVHLAPVRGLDEFVPTPEDNPLTLARVRLGERLFFDRTLSRDRSMSCASCHRPERAFADTARVSPGVDGR